MVQLEASSPVKAWEEESLVRISLKFFPPRCSRAYCSVPGLLVVLETEPKLLRMFYR